MEKRKIDMQLPKITLDDLFTTQDERNQNNLEKIIDIDLSKLDSFPNHPFKVVENQEMYDLAESIKESNVLVPAIVREKSDGRYELISGHRRKFASELAGKTTLPCIVRNLTDDEAIIMMVESNKQREKILPSEKAFSYKMKLEALNHQGKRIGDYTSVQLEHKLKSRDVLALEMGESPSSIQRYIRLTNLIPKILDMVDEERVALNPAVNLSYLTTDQQNILLDYMEMYDATPSLSQAIEMKTLSQTDKLTPEVMESIMGEEKPNQRPKLQIRESRIRSVLPKNITENKVEDFIVKSIEHYTRYLKNRQLDER